MELPTLRKILNEGIEKLKKNNISESKLDAEWILCEVLGIARVDIYINPNKVLLQNECDKFQKFIDRRSAGEPLQYITGYQEFMGLRFRVSPSVLIPRQDTEVVVQNVIDYKKKYFNDFAEILDIGTGSGAIAVSVAKLAGRCSVTAVDIDEDALEIAKYNSDYNNTDVKFMKSDLFSELDKNKKFNIIVSNPPYIRSDEIPELQKEVCMYEPLKALDGGMDGLFFYKNISKTVLQYLEFNGILILEIGDDQAIQTINIFSDFFNDIDIKKDLAGRDRAVICRKPKEA